MKNFIAKASIIIYAPVAIVWDALITPSIIERYMFGAKVISDWKEGSPIIWRGEWEGKQYEDKGTILKIKPEHIIKYSHYSSLSGKPDVPENYHKVTIKISPRQKKTVVSLSQDNNETQEERAHSAKNWQMMLKALKNIVENKYN